MYRCKLTGFSDYNSLSIMKKSLAFVSFLLLSFWLSSCINWGDTSLALQNSLQEHQIAFCGKLEGKEKFDVFLLDLSEDSWINLTQPYEDQLEGFILDVGCEGFVYPNSVTGITWSPDGAALGIGVGDTVLTHVYVMGIDKENQIGDVVYQWPRPKPYPHIFDFPLEINWSPTGENIAFIGSDTRGDNAGFANLFVGDLQNWTSSSSETQVLQLTRENREFPGIVDAPVWSPDGKVVAVSLNGPTSGMALLSVDGEKLSLSPTRPLNN